ncbi:dnaJ homolog subfamily C member 1 [Ceratina calcarata]|uniref:DnaJ homolog subfamily C member 1 n=1 Tax=Ceratina calcarata TaxID=156304 RepID=A0AAJ7N6I7_9HYME|nr:dnaJ homolog subfamily C member 1 [Ceratina calcarata]XP_017880062.1 dnaJ homolog subfamily C member 1 [Ceratina calcarata]
MRVPLLLIIGVFYTLDVSGVNAWDNDELEVFDVVEEVNQNFYEVLGVSQAANASEIKKAFRRLSLLLHPDKNPAEDAEQQFRKLVAVYDVLKDQNKRQRYDNVLVNGLPNWRSAVYYYRHVRKMGLLELGIILFLLITVGQYVIAWAAYFEKRYTYEQVLGSRLQKMQKKKKGKMDVPDLADILEKIPTPSIWNTLPFQFPRWVISFTLSIPEVIRLIHGAFEERKRRKKQEEEEALAQENEQPEPEPVVPTRVRRRRTGFTPQERSGNGVKESSKKDQTNHVDQKSPVSGGGLWTDDDILELIKLVKKYPSGTSERWEKIADAMNRTVMEVTHMAKKIKDEGLKPGTTEQTVVEERPKKTKTRAENVDNITEWSQEQQRALEAALIKYPKGTSVDRWEKIANCVEGKNKDECQARYRQLVEIVKKKQHTQ